MPVAERPALARDKGFMKFRDKNKMDRGVKILTSAMLLVLVTDTMLMIGSIQMCPVRKCIVGSEHGAMGMEDAVWSNHEDDGNLQQNGTNFTQGLTTATGIGGDDGEDDADPTRKKIIMAYEAMHTFVASFLPDSGSYKDHDADDFFFSNDIVYDHKAMFDSMILVTTY